MRVIPPSLQVYLNNGLPFFPADLYTFTLKSGAIYRWTSTDQPVTDIAGHVFSNTGPGLTRSKWDLKNTAEVATLTINMIANNTSFNGGNLKLAIHNGLFDGARIQLERAFMPTPGDASLGTVLIFEGRASTVAITATGGVLQVKADNVLFNQYMPKNLYQLTCIHTTYDPGCTLVQAANTNSNTVGASPTVNFIPWGSVPANPTFYGPNGILLMTSGAASGQQRTIKVADATGLTLMYPLYDLPSPGDTFNASKGDTKTLAVCKANFNVDNSQHWRGFPFIPSAEKAL